MPNFRTVDKSVGLVIGVPTLGRPIPIQWAFALNSLQPPINYNCQSSVIWGQEVAAARNRIAQHALDVNAKYVFFLGDDTVPPGHALKQLIYRMEHDEQLGVVGGIYASKTDPPAPLVFRGNGAGSYWNWKVGEYFECTGLGMDCTMIRTDVLRQMEQPWFRTIKEDGFLDGEQRIESWTEDLWFCNRVCEETDYKVAADAAVICEHYQHLGGYQWRAYTLRPDSYPMLGREIQGKQILDLGCGPVHWDFGDEGQVTRVDLRDECLPDYRADVRFLPFGNDQFDVVFSSHTLEHVHRAEVEETLREWIRVLKPGGELRIIVPNIAWAAEQIMAGVVDHNVLNVLYGAQDYGENFHGVGFTPQTLQEWVEKFGLCYHQVQLDGYNIILRASSRPLDDSQKKKKKQGIGKPVKGGKKRDRGKG